MYGSDLNMVHFLTEWMIGRNGIAVMLNGQHDRFRYNTCGTPDILSHICIVFTRCYTTMPNQPNRGRERSEYAERVRKFLQEVSKAQNVPAIPVFFVDSQDLNGQDT
jgi:hypothetical protein